MIKNLSNKIKFIALLVAIPLFLILAYAKIWKHVFSATSTIKEMKQQEIQAENNRKELIQLDQDLNSLDDIIGKDVKDRDVVQQEIFDIFSKKNNKSNLEKLSEPHTFNDKYYSIITNRIVLSGSFNDLIETCYFYEKEFKFSKVISTSFYTKKNYQTRKKKLYTKLVFQNYEKK